MPQNRKISHSWSVGTLVGGSKETEGPSRAPAAHQGNAQVAFGRILLRVWVELRGGCVHLYPHPSAALPIQVTPSLDQCSVALNDTGLACVVTSLTGHEELTLHLQDKNEALGWCHALGDYCRRALSLEGLNLEYGPTGGGILLPTEIPRDIRSEVLRNKGMKCLINDPVKEDLLRQMLSTKQLLERKQRHSNIKGRAAWTFTSREMTNEYERAQHDAQQTALRKAVILRQRKNSTAIKVANLEKCASGNLADQVRALKNRLESLDSEMEEAERDSVKTLQNLSDQHNNQLKIIKDYGGVDELEEERRISCAKSTETVNRLGSLHGSFTSLPSLVTAQKKERLFNFLGGNRRSRSRNRRPLMFLDKKLKIGPRHFSSDTLINQTKLRSNETFNRSTSLDSSEEENEKSQDISKSKSSHRNSGPLMTVQDEILEENSRKTSSGGNCDSQIRSEISKEALGEIKAFKQLITKYFVEHPDEKIPSHHRII